MPSASLPPMLPFGSPSVKEINMRRLMAKCDAKVQADRILQGSERSKCLSNIKALEEMLAGLEEDLSRRIDKEAFQGYADKIEALANAVGGTTSVQPSHKGLVQTRMVSDASQLVDGRQGGQDSALRRPSVAVESEKHHELKEHTHAPTDPASQLRERRSDRNELYVNSNSNNQNKLGITTSRSGGGISTSNNNNNSSTVRGDQAQVEAALQNDRAAREEMEAGLSALMQQLRHNALAIQQTLVDEQKSGLFDDANQALDTNISRLGKERARLELYSKQSRKTKWMIWGIVLGVSVVFVFMFFIIRIF
ncbi:vesicle transport protein [Linnemannia elongata]|nr:vesicle transport protein [Linnemannia elongata]